MVKNGADRAVKPRRRQHPKRTHPFADGLLVHEMVAVFAALATAKNRDILGELEANGKEAQAFVESGSGKWLAKRERNERNSAKNALFLSPVSKLHKIHLILIQCKNP